jgi:hypothetical protein
MGDVSGKGALITAGAGGIGSATAAWPAQRARSPGLEPYMHLALKIADRGYVS